jgi:imidazolonepropionase-like amidohydrolase
MASAEAIWPASDPAERSESARRQWCCSRGPDTRPDGGNVRHRAAADELRAAVEEAKMAQTYVAAHLYTDDAIACPTLVTFEALKNEGASLGLPESSVAKIDDVRLLGMQSISKMQAAGLMMVYGTDLLGPMHRHQSEEFVIRGRVQKPIDVIRSSTIHAAVMLRQEGRIGCVAPGALADLIVVDGDPLADLALLTHQGAHMPAIMQGGRFVKNTLN